MPKRGKRRKKRRTHIVENIDEMAPVPKSMVLQSPNEKLGKDVLNLMEDMKTVMLPYTALKLRVKRSNGIKDFVDMAGPLNVSHFMLFGQTEKHTNMRIACVPRGPTLSFQIDEFSLAGPVRAIQRRPIDPHAHFKTSPLVVLNNFPKETKHLQLAALTFQNMFPAINIQTIKLNECRRVVLYNYLPEKDMVEFRHYGIRAVPTGVHRTIRKLIQAKIPDLSNSSDIADAILGTSVFGGASDSEHEDDESALTLPDNYRGRGNRKSGKSAIKLAELGPRLTMKLTKIQRELCKGEVVYHAFESRNAEESAANRAKIDEREASKAERKAVQAANVERKMEARAAKLEARKQRREQRAAELEDEEDSDSEEVNSDKESAEDVVGDDASDSEEGDDEEASDVESVDDEEVVSEEESESEEEVEVVKEVTRASKVHYSKNVAEEEVDEDLEWYRKETGSEPTKEMKLDAKVKSEQRKANAKRRAAREAAGIKPKKPKNGDVSISRLPKNYQKNKKNNRKFGGDKDDDDKKKKKDDGPRGWVRPSKKRKAGGKDMAPRGSKKQKRK